MNSLLSIRIQKLFLITVILKVVSSFFGWYLQLQWSLGFFLPLLVMATYIALGLKRQDRDVTDEKFADSCYYLGFIFTITSIVFSLFDLPSIGERIQDIAVRFGAAMVSTVSGLIVRVYLVSFRPDFNDAIKASEDAVLDAVQKFREQLLLAYEKLNDFQSQVSTATQTSVETARLQVEKLTKDHSERMEKVFLELNERNQEAVTRALMEVSETSDRVAQSLDDYAEDMKGTLQSLGEKINDFGDSLTERLKTTTFPDDYFASRLAEPLEQLRAASEQVSEQVQSAASSASEAGTVMTAAIRKLKNKAMQAEESLDTIVRLTTAQHSLFDTAATQLDQLKLLSELLAKVQQELHASNSANAANALSNSSAQLRVTEVIEAVDASQKVVVEALGQVCSRLDVERAGANSLVTQVQLMEAAAKELAQELRKNSSAAQQLTAKLATEIDAKPQLTAVVDALRAQQISTPSALQP